MMTDCVIETGVIQSGVIEAGAIERGATKGVGAPADRAVPRPAQPQPLVARREGEACPSVRPASSERMARAASNDLFAQIRNAETAIRGFCQLAGEAVIPPDQALAGIEQAMGMLARARGLAEEAEARRAGLPFPLGPDALAPRVAG